MRVEHLGEDVTLYLGDCLEILPTLAAGIFNVVVADLPYGIEGGRGGQARERGKGKYETTKWTDTEDYIREIMAPLVGQLLSKTERMALTVGIKCLFFYPRPDDIGCFWTPAAVGVGSWGFTTYHPILYYGKDYRAGRGALPTGIKVTERAEKNGHPCPKPIGAWTWLVKKVSQPGDTVLDFTMGSGTTGVACVQTGRKFIGIEIDPGYFEIACKRIQEAQLQMRLPV